MTSLFKNANAVVGVRSKAMYERWKALAKGRLAPRRDEISLGVVRNLAQWFWMIDVVDGGADFRFGLAGDQINRFYGYHLRGTLLSECPDTAYFRALRGTLLRCVHHKAAFAVGPVPSDYPGKEHLEVEKLMLPVSDDGETVNGIVGMMETWPVGTFTTTDLFGRVRESERN